MKFFVTNCIYTWGGLTIFKSIQNMIMSKNFPYRMVSYVTISASKFPHDGVGTRGSVFFYVSRFVPQYLYLAAPSVSKKTSG